MYRKYFFKSKGVLSRRFVASGLAAVFSAGMFGSYAGAMEPAQNLQYLFPRNEEPKLANVLNKDSISGDDENAEKVFKFFINFIYFKSFLHDYVDFLFNNVDKSNIELLRDEGFSTRVFAYLLLFKFYEFEAEGKIDSIDVILNRFKDKGLLGDFIGVRYLSKDDKTNLLNKINNGWGKDLLEKVKEGVEKEKLKKDKPEIIIENLQNESTDEHELDKNKTKNKFRNTIFVVSVVIIFLFIFFAKKLAGKSKTNTGVPNNNNNNNKNDEKINPSIEPGKDKDDEKVNPSIEPEKDKDDEKVNPSIEPEKDKDDEKVNPSIEPEKDKDDEKVKPPIDPREPSTDPESDEQNPEQDNREEKPSVVLSNILKATGATVTAGTLAGGTYLFNKVLKSGKPSEVKNSRNVDDKYMYLDSDVNEVTKTEESEKTHDNYDTDGESADNSGTKQLLEDKDTEEKEEGQEEILVGDALSDDTEATSDEDKNKD